MQHNVRCRTACCKSHVLAGCLAFSLFVGFTRPGAEAGAQVTHSGLPANASGHIPGSPDNDDEAQRQMARKLELRRNEDRQKQLVKDTNQLLALATDLKTEVDKTDKNVLSVEVVKKADAIEKLAKNVRDRMKSQ